MKYAVKIEETLSRTCIVEADSWADAQNKVIIAHDNSEVILDAEDFDEVNFIPSETFGENPIAEDDKRLDYFTKLDTE